MKVNTRHFGEMEIDEKEIIHFTQGLLGFEDIEKYVVIRNPDSEVPFDWLQSVDEPNLTFVITNPFIFVNNYEFDIPDKVVRELELGELEDVIIYSITVVTEKIEDMTINLKGPVIINAQNGKGKQIVLEDDNYTLKYKIFDSLKKIG